jgi:hypothetical protein
MSAQRTAIRRRLVGIIFAGVIAVFGNASKADSPRLVLAGACGIACIATEQSVNYLDDRRV